MHATVTLYMGVQMYVQYVAVLAWVIGLRELCRKLHGNNYNVLMLKSRIYDIEEQYFIIAY